MGHGIAQCAAQAGHDVVLWGTDDRDLSLAQDRMRASLKKLHAKGRVAESPETVLRRVAATTDLARCSRTEFCIESVLEDVAIKRDVFAALDSLVGPQAILASNSSTIPISRLAEATGRPGRCVGMHFCSPVPLMPVAEVIRSAATEDNVVSQSAAFVRSLGKEVIHVRHDVPGFVLNRINLAGNVEAIRLLENDVAAVDDIDKAMRLGFGRPMGPFETADMVGLDTGYRALLALYTETGEEKFRPPELLRCKVESGQLGHKSGCGWYVYGAGGERVGVAELPAEPTQADGRMR